MDDQYLQIELIKAVGNIAKAFNRIADAIEHRTDKEFPNFLEEVLHEEQKETARKTIADLDPNPIKRDRFGRPRVEEIP